MRETYTYRASIPPEGLRRRLEEAVRKENAAAGRARRIRLKWTALDRFALRVNFYSRFPGGAEWGRSGAASFSAAVTGTRVEAAFSDVFRGQIAPDGAGGSLLKGRFGLLGPATVFLGAFGAGFLLLAALTGKGGFLLGVLGAAIGALDVRRTRDSWPSSRWIAGFLEYYVSGPGGLSGPN